MPKGNPALVREAIYDVVRRQIENGTPLETEMTLLRLMSEGKTGEEAMRLLACVVSSEILRLVKNRVMYDEVKFIQKLNALPVLPLD